VIEWQRIEGRRWERICDCGTESTYEPAPSRVRLDPYDPATSRHAGQCEFKDTTDRDILKVLLKVKAGMGEGYSWVTCGSCEHEWGWPTTPRRASGDGEGLGIPASPALIAIEHAERLSVLGRFSSPGRGGPRR
jgi:hypothetical protein